MPSIIVVSACLLIGSTGTNAKPSSSIDVCPIYTEKEVGRKQVETGFLRKGPDNRPFRGHGWIHLKKTSTDRPEKSTREPLRAPARK